MKFVALILTLTAGFAQAHAETQTLSAKVDTGVADHTHFFNSGLKATSLGAGLTLGYSYRLNGHVLVGLGAAHYEDSDSSEGGSLDTAQYYKDDYKLKTTNAEVNTTFFFKEDGYGKWGFLMRGAVGHSWQNAEAKWGRYDRNPAFIILFGDDRRLREEGTSKKEWQSTYAKAGGYYQFLWGFHEGNRVGHVLELGAEVLQFDQSRKLGYTKPNGQSKDHDVQSTVAALQLTYSIAF
jgi:hypothetical protein